MKKQLLFIFCLLSVLLASCKKAQPSEFLVSEIETLKSFKNPGIKEEFPINQKITFYVIEVV